MSKKKSMEEISSLLIDTKESLVADFGVQHIAVYGSYARGQQKATSDIDFWVELDENKSLLDLCSLKIFLEKKLNLEVEVARKECLRKELRKYMLAESVEIF